MFSRWWQLAKRIIVVVGVLLFFFAVLEVIRAYETLSNLHVWAGYAFLLVLLVGLIGLIAYGVKGFFFRPAVVRPPRFVDRNSPTLRELQRYRKYLDRYIDRLCGNKLIGEDRKSQALVKRTEIAEAKANQNNAEQLQSEIEAIEKEVIKALLVDLDEQAEKEIRRCVRDVMAAVTFVPYRSVDVAIVLYRNLVMVVRVVKVYNSRPRTREMFRIFIDTLKVVALVNYFDLGRSMLEDLGSKVPGIGRLVDDIAEGTGAGFMTSIVGHAAKQRCRAFRGWNEAKAKQDLSDQVANFYKDVKDLFKKDFLPALMARVADKSKETWDKVVSVLDDTGSRIGDFVKVALRRKS